MSLVDWYQVTAKEGWLGFHSPGWQVEPTRSCPPSVVRPTDTLIYDHKTNGPWKKKQPVGCKKLFGSREHRFLIVVVVYSNLFRGHATLNHLVQSSDANNSTPT